MLLMGRVLGQLLVYLTFDKIISFLSLCFTVAWDKDRSYIRIIMRFKLGKQFCSTLLQKLPQQKLGHKYQCSL